MKEKTSKDQYQDIPLNKIDPPAGHVRLDIPQERIIELAENIREQGLLQPILVRLTGDRYEVVFGHRRYLAFGYLRLETIPARLVEMNDASVALARASENLIRDDLSPIEEGAIYVDLLDTHGLTYEEIGKKMGKSPGVVKRRMDLLKMPPSLQQAIHLKQISYSVAESLWSLGDESAIGYYLGFAVDHGVTLTVVRQWVKDHLDKIRREQTGTDRVHSPRSPIESRPVFVACDWCSGPMEIGNETVYRICPDCNNKIKEVFK